MKIPMGQNKDVSRVYDNFSNLGVNISKFGKIQSGLVLDLREDDTNLIRK